MAKKSHIKAPGTDWDERLEPAKGKPVTTATEGDPICVEANNPPPSEMAIGPVSVAPSGEQVHWANEIKFKWFRQHVYHSVLWLEQTPDDVVVHCACGEQLCMDRAAAQKVR